MVTTERVGVVRREADPREVLHRRDHALRLEARWRTRSDRAAVWTALNDQVRPCAVHERGRGGGHVGDRSEVDVDAERLERGTRARALRAGDGRAVEGAHLRRGQGRWRPRDPLDRAHLPGRPRSAAAAGRPPWRPPGALRSARSAASGVVTLEPNRISPPISPRPIRPRRLGARRGAVHPDDQLLADQLGQRRCGDRRGRVDAAVAVAAAPPMPPRRPRTTR